MAESEPTVDAVKVDAFNLWYGDFQALFDVDLRIKSSQVTALIGPSGCGKSTLLRCCNRIIERLSYVRNSGQIHVFGHNVLDPNNEINQVRRNVGMVFQRPNPLPLSIRDNILFGYRLHEPEAAKRKDELDALVQESLEKVLLWDDVKDRLAEPAGGLSLEAQQKLCIARLLPVKPRLLLMDEPCSALDPEATRAVEELIFELRGEYTILMVTHNMAQARRASDECVFMLMGKVIEHSPTDELFVTPKQRETADYIEGRYG